MNPVRRAVIDVGTNSIKLLVADVAGTDVRPVVEQSHQTRLGRGFYATHRLQPAAIAHSAETVAAFTRTARQQEAASIRVIATSAARDAKNSADLTEALERASGLLVEIISGEQEAALAFRGVATDPVLARLPLLLLDVGGGSTEFILGQGPWQHFCRSFPLGAVRLLEQLPHSDPPTADELRSCRQWLREFLDREVRAQLAPSLRDEASAASPSVTPKLVGTGGTATILGRMALETDGFDRARIEAVVLPATQLTGMADDLWRLPLAERKQIPGLPANRADVILFGVVIYEAVMRGFGFEELRLSTRGLRFAAVMDPPRT